MKTVWVIEQGGYSDYRVIGVFTSKENAELVMAAIDSKWDEPSIAEWPLDPAVNELQSGRARWFVLMKKNGDVEEARKDELSSWDLVDDASIWERSTAPAYQGTDKAVDVLQVRVWAKDEKHAIKIANERRTQMISSGEWK